jgi:hypothetical protein
MRLDLVESSKRQAAESRRIAANDEIPDAGLTRKRGSVNSDNLCSVSEDFQSGRKVVNSW